MAIVFLARDLTRGRDVALKVLRPEMGPVVGAQRFLREIGILAQLDHPHILPLLDSGEAGNLLYCATAFARGGTLRSRMDKGGRLPLNETAAIAADVGAALDYAHGRGFIHRDIKPENILFEDARALVCDFGIARAVDIAAGEQLSSSGILVGTPAYMSPEQSTSGAPLDGRSDIYALGCVVYEMLAGEPPFTGATPAAVFARHRAQAPSPLRVVRPDLPVHVDEAIRRALAKSPRERPSSTMAFVNELRGD